MDNPIDYITIIKHARIVDPTLIKVMAKTVLIAEGLAMLFLILTVAYNYIKNAISSITSQQAEKIIDINDIARVLVTMGLIGLYIPIVQATMGMVEIVVDQSKVKIFNSDKTLEEYQEKMADKYIYTNEEIEALRATLQNTNDEGKQKIIQAEIDKNVNELKNGEKIEKGGKNIITALLGFSTYSISQRLTSIIVTMLGNLVAVVALGIAKTGLKLLLLLGPLAFAFSIIPAFKSQITIWASATLNFAFAQVTINLLNTIDVMYLQSMSIYPLDYENGPAYSIAKIVLYSMPFWFTAKYVGKGEGGAFVGKAMGMATAAVAAAMTGGASAAASGGKGVFGKVFSSGKKATDSEKEEN